MSSAVPPSTAYLQLSERLASKPDHPHFTGPALDIAGLTPLELGRLWGPLERARRNPDDPANKVAAAAMSEADRHGLRPAFDSGTVAAALATVPEQAWYWLDSILCCIVAEPHADARPEALRILGDPAAWASNVHPAYLLARMAGPDIVAQLRQLAHERFAGANYFLQEFDLLDCLSWSTAQSIACASGLYWPGERDEKPDPAFALAGEADYVDFAHDMLSVAARRLQDIHEGVVPYQADGAFNVADSPVLARAARVAALRDEPWFGELAPHLLPLACVAPTAAKTAPSQSLAIALGHSCEGVPTPESVEALRQAIKIVRHAGLAKKLARNLKPAERALAGRPDLVLRMATLALPGKRQKTALASSLEAGFVHGFQVPWSQWKEQLAQTAVGKEFARELIWTVTGVDGQRTSFMLDKGSKILPQRVDGTAVALEDDAVISLWHPATATPNETAAWQEHLTARQLRQPLRQAFREVYFVDPADQNGSTAFTGHMLSLRSLLGLARREGWRIESSDRALARQFGSVRVMLYVNSHLYPGIEGWGETTGLHFQERRERRWIGTSAAELDPVVFSEICRAVDLLVSTAAFAIDNGEDVGYDRERQERLSHMSALPLGQMSMARKRILERVLAPLIDEGVVAVRARHIELCGHAIHLTTGRVTRDGAPVELILPAGKGNLVALPWLPYDEVLLEKIVRTVAALRGA